MDKFKPIEEELKRKAEEEERQRRLAQEESERIDEGFLR